MSARPLLLDRRAVLRVGLLGAAGLAGSSLITACGGSGPDTAGPSLAARVEDSQAGTAGAVIRPVTERHGLVGDLDLTYVAGTGPGDVQNKLLSGALDVASMGPLGATVAAEAGAELVLFSTSLNNHVRWLVPENSPYRTVDDLRGKKIATPPNNSDAFRSTQLALAVNGSDFTTEYQLFPGAVLAGLALFDRGDVDAIVTIEPNATRLVAKGARQVATVGELWAEGTGEDPNTLFLNGQGASRKWVDANRETAAALAALRLEAHRIIHDRPAVLAELHEAYGVPADEKAAIELLPTRMRDIYPTEWGEQVFANLRRQVQVAEQVGLVKAVPAQPLWVDLGAAS
ncbi:NitT/TauT family transport system substrate-binding protein [Pseudonocardia thermophila]|jgi:ABC-type nitrate/sulfonate/bicarbonate transport systems, periplasmic components|uniref:NitT/TauT family transport system substrate-binding protein n=1 Tax=Pseudonocardia thermophila TaxID=1848 RepID=A0A1M6XWV1_PSETH|nr:PhnD/SsuA/transferrin family substrate-binding protein [Pseudonocardia thermophila]SHL10474.1 NitT/TauT family transport system substrate-binding protein [Pseudonocardia thermophila]